MTFALLQVGNLRSTGPEGSLGAERHLDPLGLGVDPDASERTLAALSRYVLTE